MLTARLLLQSSSPLHIPLLQSIAPDLISSPLLQSVSQVICSSALLTSKLKSSVLVVPSLSKVLCLSSTLTFQDFRFDLHSLQAFSLHALSDHLHLLLQANSLSHSYTWKCKPKYQMNESASTAQVTDFFPRPAPRWGPRLESRAPVEVAGQARVSCSRPSLDLDGAVLNVNSPALVCGQPRANGNASACARLVLQPCLLTIQKDGRPLLLHKFFALSSKSPLAERERETERYRRLRDSVKTKSTHSAHLYHHL